MIQKSIFLYREFMKLESAGGILLALAAVLALIVKNSVFSDAYGVFLNTPVTFAFGKFSIDKPLFLWVNDGFMAIFFLLAVVMFTEWNTLEFIRLEICQKSYTTGFLCQKFYTLKMRK